MMRTHVPSQGDAAESRKLALRMRCDLLFAQSDADRRGFWVAKDPVALEYHRLGTEEYFLLQALDGSASLESLKKLFERRFSPRQISVRQISAFLGRLHELGLVTSEAPGQGEQLTERRDRRRWRRRAQTFSNLLAIRLPAIDPTRVLDWLVPVVAMFAKRGGGLAAATIVLTASLLVVWRFEDVLARVPSVQQFVDPQNVGLLVICFAAAKVLHELAHAVTCRWFGAECHRMGILLLVFVPCLYCDVSDAWMLAKRWQRIAVSAAGMVAEIVLASACLWVWWFSSPGLLNSICFNVMVACSVTTVLFNINPLLRYDGYYMLADLVRVPNLWESSRGVLRRAALWTCFGIETSDGLPISGRRGWLALYAFSSIIYRIVVLVAILWWIRGALQQHQLERLADLLILTTAGGLVAMPVYAAGRGMANPQTLNTLRPRRVFSTVMVFAAVLFGVAYVPVPLRVSAPAVVEARNAETIYVTVPGRLSSYVDLQQAVVAGDAVLELSNLELRKELVRLRGIRDRQSQHVSHLERLRIGFPEAGQQIPAARETLVELEGRVAEMEQDVAGLTVTTKTSGRLLPAAQSLDPESDPLELVSWSGLLQGPENIGAYLDVGTPVCQIGDPRSMMARIMLDESEVARVQVGQRVRMRFEGTADMTLTGHITDVAVVDSVFVPREFAGVDEIPTDIDDRGSVRPVGSAYAARVTFDDDQTVPPLRARGMARISVAWTPLGVRAAEFVRRTFAF